VPTSAAPAGYSNAPVVTRILVLVRSRRQHETGVHFCSGRIVRNDLASTARRHVLAFRAGVRRRFAPHELRHAHAVELLHEGIPLPLIQRQLGHSHLSTTGTYLQGIDTEEVISTVHARRAPMMHASAGLALYPNRGSASCAPATLGLDLSSSWACPDRRELRRRP
jgi:hypothetical protein